ncbi:MAG: hypothetical protein ACKPBU_12625 [Alphaproteobacteria bacterium]
MVSTLIGMRAAILSFAFTSAVLMRMVRSKGSWPACTSRSVSTA